MADRAVRRSVDDGGSAPTEEASDDAVWDRTPWVGFYRYLHRRLRYRNAVFGGAALAGAAAIVYSFGALSADAAGNFATAIYAVVGGVVLTAFGVGYFVVRRDTSCEACGATFSTERVGKHLVDLERDAATRTLVAERLKCRECGHHTTQPYVPQDRESLRW